MKRKTIPKLTLQALRAIPRGELPWFLWNFYLNLYERIVGYRSTAAAREKFERTLPRGIQLVRSYTQFDGNVLNGGVRQYVTNCTGFRGQAGEDEVMEDLEALRTIGASESVKLLRRAIAIYRRYGWPLGKDHRWLDMSSKDEAACERIDAARCNDESSRRDYALLEKYLRRHLEDCVYPARSR